jgi:hypothetical protein
MSKTEQSVVTLSRLPTRQRRAVILLAGLADWNSSLCRRAALDAELWEPLVQRLLLDPAEERG